VTTDSVSMVPERELVLLYRLVVLELANADSLLLDLLPSLDRVTIFVSSFAGGSGGLGFLATARDEKVWVVPVGGAENGAVATETGAGAPMRLRRDPESGISGMSPMAGKGWCGEVGGVERDTEEAADGGSSRIDKRCNAEKDGDGGISSGCNSSSPIG
jgi:hypothetical protein